MARKFLRGETIPSTAAETARLGAQNAPYKDTEIGKFVKISGEGFVLCAVGELIDGYIVGVEAATADGYGIGSVQRCDRKYVTFDGTQAAGTGTLAVGDYVVCGTAVAKDTSLGQNYAKVRKATIQPGTTVAADLTAMAAQMAMLPSLWRVVSLGTAGTGAVGTVGLIERVSGVC